MKLNQKLQSLRKERGITQEELAEQLGVSRQAISKWETGDSVPDMNNMVELARLFGISMDDLLQEDLSQRQKEQKERSCMEGMRQGRIAFALAILLGVLGILGLACVFAGYGVEIEYAMAWGEGISDLWTYLYSFNQEMIFYLFCGMALASPVLIGVLMRMQKKIKSQEIASAEKGALLFEFCWEESLEESKKTMQDFFHKLLHSQRIALCCGMVFALIAWGGTCLALGRIDVYMTLVCGISIVVLGLMLRNDRFQAWAMMCRAKKLIKNHMAGPKTTIQFYENRIIASEADLSLPFSYDGIRDFMEMDDYYAFLLSRWLGTAILIKKGSLSLGKEEEFPPFLLEKCPRLLGKMK